MKAESTLARVNAVLALGDDLTAARHELEKLAADLAGQVRCEVAASRGVGNAAATIRRILNHSRKSLPGRSLHYAWTDEKGRQCICDGFRAFRLNEPLPLEPRPDDAGDGIDLEKVFPDIAAGAFDPLPTPRLADLKAHIALERAAKGRKTVALWDFGPGRPVFNAAYLVDLLAVLPDAAEIYVQRGSAGLASPLYAKGKRGDAILLPVSSSDSAARSMQAEALQRAHAAAGILTAYNAAAEREAMHCMTLDDFAELAQYAYQPA